ncbi:MAG: ribonuclease HII [Rhodospirillaceae bacterium]|nr:ribonuclease HII [Rhodospirillaceae bacterium]
MTVRARPDLAHEVAAGHPGRRIAGVDEVGRGPLAGPLVAAAVVVPPGGLPAALAARIDDSKRLSAAVRTELAGLIAQHCASGVGSAAVAEIDTLGLSAALALAMGRALAALPQPPDHALVDGRWRPPGLPCPITPVVKGDQRCLSVAAASILAKVARDAEMLRLAALYPGYGWARNVGYGTAEHLAGLARLGPTPHHRLSFRPIAAMVEMSHEEAPITL